MAKKGGAPENLKPVRTKEEAKKVIEEAGIELTDEEMNQVAGGVYLHNKNSKVIKRPRDL